MTTIKEKGFTLIEMLIALAISAIIIGAAFGSYTIIARNFEWQADMKYMSQSARSVVEMMTKDIRNAGFRFESSAAITDPVKIYDAGDAKDRIEIIYDETESPYKRVKIEYRLQQYSNDNTRFRLYKKKTNMTNNTVEYDSPIADYIESLQFTGAKNSSAVGTGELPNKGQWGIGNFKVVKASDAKSTCEDNVTNVDGDSGALTASGNALYAIDGSMFTAYSCHSSNPRSNWPNFGFSGNLEIYFDKPVRLTEIKVWLSPHIDISNGSRFFGTSRNTWEEPFGKFRPVSMNGSTLYIDPWAQIPDHRCIYDPAIHEDCYVPFKWERMSGEINSDGFIKFEPDSSYFGNFFYQIMNGFSMKFGHQEVCEYSGNPPTCSLVNAPYREISEITFKGEVFGEPQIPQEVEVGLLVRSPSEHGNVDRSFSETIGDYSFSANDKYLRDNYVTSATMRNIYYQSQ